MMDFIGTKIPRHVLGDWVRYCRRLRIGQSQAIRQALALWIEANERATADDLALAAQIRDAPCRAPRA